MPRASGRNKLPIYCSSSKPSSSKTSSSSSSAERFDEAREKFALPAAVFLVELILCKDKVESLATGVPDTVALLMHRADAMLHRSGSDLVVERISPEEAETGLTTALVIKLLCGCTDSEGGVFDEVEEDTCDTSSIILSVFGD